MRGIVTRRAIVIKVILRVIRTCGSGEISRVTRVTRTASVGVAGRMTGQASNAGVAAGQQEPGSAMIKAGGIPGCRRVTGGAVVIKIILHMIRVSC